MTISYPRKLKPYQHSSYVFCAFYRRTGYLSSKIPLPNLPTSSAVYLDIFQSHFIFQVAIILNSAVLGCQPSSYADISRCRSFFGLTVAFLATTYVAAVGIVTKNQIFYCYLCCSRAASSPPFPTDRHGIVRPYRCFFRSSTASSFSTPSWLLLLLRIIATGIARSANVPEPRFS